MRLRCVYLSCCVYLAQTSTRRTKACGWYSRTTGSLVAAGLSWGSQRLLKLIQMLWLPSLRGNKFLNVAFTNF